MSSSTEDVMGFNIYNGTLDDLISKIANAITEGHLRTFLACFNPHSYAVSKKDDAFTEALHKATWLVPDGVGVVLASKILRGAIHQRVTGPDVFLGLHRHFNEVGNVKVFFLGSSENNLANIVKKMSLDFPKVQVAGVYSPPFRDAYNDQEMEKMIGYINASQADILWVGMTAPKQEKWIMQSIDRLEIGFVGAIGAMFDFYTGNVKRPTRLFRDLGLEWLPRLIREPKRLWRRMFISAPIFLADVVKQRFRQLPF